MGIRQAMGGDVAWVSDIDPGPCKILAHRYPGVPNLGDVTAVDWTQVEPVDLICGGSPCQDVSTAGRRAGMRPGTRSGLWESMREAIATIRPAYAVWENVRGALSAEAHSEMVDDEGRMGDGAGRPVLRALGRVLGDLADLGYDAEWRGLRASDVGAPHQRYRIFVLARRRGYVADADNTGLEGRQPVRERAGQQPVGPGGVGAVMLLPTPRTSDTNGAGAHGTGGADLRTAVALLPTPRATDGTNGGPNQRGSKGDMMLPSAVHQLLPTPSVADTQGGRKHRSKDRSDELLLNGIAHHDRWGDYAPAIARWERVIGRSAPTPSEPYPRRVSPNPMPDRRRLSPAFVEWMMGLPAGWITDVPGITRNEALKACGNGVVPQQAATAISDMLAAFTADQWTEAQ